MSEVNSYGKNLTDVEHQDQSKHFIGEALPVPSAEEVAFAGVETSAGTSPFPARADHSHDARARFMGATAEAVVIPAGGSAYLDGFTIPWGTEDFLASGSSQLFEFPQEGAYDLTLEYRLERATGTFPASCAYTIQYDFFNATAPLVVEYGAVPVGLSLKVGSIRTFHYFDEIDSTKNVQILVTNTDTEDWNFTPFRFEMHRRHSSEGAVG